MTIQKKLISIGVALSFLATVLIVNPGGAISSLTSRMLRVDDPTIDHQILVIPKTF